MKLAIVGTSHLTNTEKVLARVLIYNIVNSVKPDILITGDAGGIDELVRECGNEDRESKVHFAIDKQWGGDGYKERNIRIANDADKVISITTRLKHTPCYHCSANHERTGGCWTMKYAKSIGKLGEVILLHR